MNGSHLPDCGCQICQSLLEGNSRTETMEAVEEWESQKLEKYGWYAHLVMLDNGLLNCHTHGLQDKYDHPDLQIVLPLPQKTVMNILHTVVDRIAQGEQFCHGQKAQKVIKNFPVKFINATEGGRHVLRIIFPDPAGNLDEGTMTDSYNLQYSDLGD